MPISSLHLVRALSLCLAPLLLWQPAVVAAPTTHEANAALGALKQRLQSGAIPNVHSVIVIQHERTLAEWYFEGEDERRGLPLGVVRFTPQTLHDLRSVTKSVVSLLFGIAMADGAIKTLDEPVLDYFPEYKDLQTPDRRKIRLRDLLDMTSGLHWDETSYPYTDVRNSEIAMDLAADRYRFILSQPIDDPPGTKWRYSGGDVALIAAVIARATKTPLDAYAREKLFHPLGITKYEWLKDSKGEPYAASGLRMRPRDMAKLGLLVLHDGRAAGRQLVPAAWIKEATTAHAKAMADPRCPIEYGYFWWLGPACDPPWIAGIGNGGQSIWVVPSLDAVIVATAGLYNSPRQNETREILEGVLNALR